MSAQSHAAQGLPRQPVPFILRYASDGQWQGHILQCRVLGQVVVALEHKANIAAAEPCPLFLVHSLQMMLASDNDLTLRGRLKACQHIQHGGLTGAAAACDTDKFALQHGHVHAVQRTDRVAADGVVLLQPHRPDDRFSFTHSSLSLSQMWRAAAHSSAPPPSGRI